MRSKAESDAGHRFWWTPCDEPTNIRGEPRFECPNIDSWLAQGTQSCTANVDDLDDWVVKSSEPCHFPIVHSPPEVMSMSIMFTNISFLKELNTNMVVCQTNLSAYHNPEAMHSLLSEGTSVWKIIVPKPSNSKNLNWHNMILFLARQIIMTALRTEQVTTDTFPSG